MKILIVEDEHEVLEFYAEALQEEATVECFDNPKEAYRRFIEGPRDFDLVIVDQFLPEKTGEAFIFDIKQLNPSQAIVVISASASEVKTPANFGVELLQKPVSGRQLRQLMD